MKPLLALTRFQELTGVMKRRLLLALTMAIAASVVSLTYTHYAPRSAQLRPDFDHLWFASRALLHGHDPYPLIGPGRAFDWPFGLNYPLPALIVLWPLTTLPVAVARTLFVAAGAAVFTLATTAEGFALVPILISGPMFGAAERAQWSPWLAAAFTLPTLGALFSAKPTVGAAVWLSKPSLRAVVGALALIALSLALVPRWPMEWISATHSTEFVLLVQVPGGALLLLALLRWRLPEARLLAALSLVPYTPTHLYDSLYVMLVAKTRREALLLATLSLVSYELSVRVPFEGARGPYIEHVATVVLWTLYLPALAIVLRRSASRPDWPLKFTRFGRHIG